jgi:hypothetical protein
VIRFCIYSRAGSFITSFETLDHAEAWRMLRGVTQYTIRKERWR